MSDRKKYIILIFLISFLFGIIRYQMVIQPTGGVFMFPSDDSYITLRYAKKVVEGHPFKINPDDEFPSPLEPSIVAQFLYASGSYIGFKTPESLSSFVYWLNIILLSVTLIIFFLLLTGWKFSLLDAFIVIVLCLLYNPFRYLFTLDMGWGIFTMLFYILLYFVFIREKSFYFLIPAIILSLTRPESIYILVFLFLFYFFKKDVKKALLVIIPIAVNLTPAIIFYLFIKTPFPSGFKPQFILTHYHYSSAISMIFRYIIDYFKSILLGFYPLNATGYNYIEHGFSPLPPLFFIFILIGVWRIFNDKKEDRTIYLFSITLFILALFVSSVTIYQGVHLLRHTAWLLPFFIVIGVKGLLYLGGRLNFLKILIPFYILMFIGSSIDFLVYVSLSSVYNTLPHYQAARWIDENLEEPNLMGIVNSRIDYFIKNKAKFYNITPGDNWRMTKYCKDIYNLAAPFELFNYELKEEEEWFLIWTKDDETTVNFEYFVSLAGDTLYKKYYLFNNYFKIAKLKKGPFLNAEKIHLSSEYEVLDEFNPGDPISERDHKYDYLLTLPYAKVKFYPVMGKIINPKTGEEDYIIEGATFTQYEKFNLHLKNLSIDTLFLIGRFASEINCAIAGYLRAYIFPVKMPSQKFNIFINGEKVDSVKLSDLKNFSEYAFYIPRALLKKGENTIEIEGPHISCRWFVVHFISRE